MLDVTLPRRPISLRRYQWLIAAAALLALAAFRLWSDAPVPAASARHATVQTPFAAGPALPVNAGMDEARGDLRLEGALEITPDGRLVPNQALLDVLNYFLLARPDDKSAAALNNYLSKKLPAPAAADAMRIASSYQAYMQAHDELLAAQNLHVEGAGVTAAELARLSTWRELRARLRERSLDKPVVQAWYQDEDLQLAQTIDELQRSSEAAGAGQGPAASGDAPFRPVPHWRNKADQERHQAYLLGVITKAITRFDTLKRARN